MRARDFRLSPFCWQQLTQMGEILTARRPGMIGKKPSHEYHFGGSAGLQEGEPALQASKGGLILEPLPLKVFHSHRLWRADQTVIRSKKLKTVRAIGGCTARASNRQPGMTAALHC
jgi:hypothetical protein